MNHTLDRLKITLPRLFGLAHEILTSPPSYIPARSFVNFGEFCLLTLVSVHKLWPSLLIKVKCVTVARLQSQVYLQLSSAKWPLRLSVSSVTAVNSLLHGTVLQKSFVYPLLFSDSHSTVNYTLQANTTGFYVYRIFYNKLHLDRKKVRDLSEQ